MTWRDGRKYTRGAPTDDEWGRLRLGTELASLWPESPPTILACSRKRSAATLYAVPGVAAVPMGTAAPMGAADGKMSGAAAQMIPVATAIIDNHRAMDDADGDSEKVTCVLNGTARHLRTLLRRLLDRLTSAFEALRQSGGGLGEVDEDGVDPDAMWREAIAAANKELWEETRACAAVSHAKRPGFTADIWRRMPAEEYPDMQPEWDPTMCSACFWLHDPSSPRADDWDQAIDGSCLPDTNEHIYFTALLHYLLGAYSGRRFRLDLQGCHALSGVWCMQSRMWAQVIPMLPMLGMSLRRVCLSVCAGADAVRHLMRLIPPDIQLLAFTIRASVKRPHLSAAAQEDYWRKFAEALRVMLQRRSGRLLERLEIMFGECVPQAAAALLPLADGTERLHVGGRELDFARFGEVVLGRPRPSLREIHIYSRRLMETSRTDAVNILNGLSSWLTLDHDDAVDAPRTLILDAPALFVTVPDAAITTFARACAASPFLERLGWRGAVPTFWAALSTVTGLAPNQAKVAAAHLLPPRTHTLDLPCPTAAAASGDGKHVIAHGPAVCPASAHGPAVCQGTADVIARGPAVCPGTADVNGAADPVGVGLVVGGASRGPEMLAGSGGCNDVDTAKGPGMFPVIAGETSLGPRMFIAPPAAFPMLRSLTVLIDSYATAATLIACGILARLECLNMSCAPPGCEELLADMADTLVRAGRLQALSLHHLLVPLGMGGQPCRHGPLLKSSPRHGCPAWAASREAVCPCLDFLRRLLSRHALTKLRIYCNVGRGGTIWRGCSCTDCHGSREANRRLQILGLMRIVADCPSAPEFDDDETAVYLGTIAPPRELHTDGQDWDAVDDPIVNNFKAERAELGERITRSRAATVRRLQAWRAIALLTAFMRANAANPLLNSGLAIVRRHFPPNADPHGLNHVLHNV